MKTLLKDKPWLPFIVSGLIAQQANMLTYKFGGQEAKPYVFLIYSFFAQFIVNIILMLILKKDFPLVLQGKMRLWVCWVALIYVLVDTLFISIYTMGAPYGLMMTVMSLMGIINMTIIGLVFIKETVSRKQIGGIVLAMIAITLVKLG